MPEVTAVFAALSALMLVVMAADAARLRRAHRVPLQGVGQNKHVNRAVRIHGNFAEHVPLALVLMLLLELRGAPPTWLTAAGITLLIARVLHWIGLKTSSGSSAARFGGVGLTWAVLLGEAGALLVSILGGAVA